MPKINELKAIDYFKSGLEQSQPLEKPDGSFFKKIIEFFDIF